LAIFLAAEIGALQTVPGFYESTDGSRFASVTTDRLRIGLPPGPLDGQQLAL
jgi:hypothetical protein